MFWYLNDRRFARIDLVRIARSFSNSRIELVIDVRLFLNLRFFTSSFTSSSIRNGFTTVLLKSIESDDNSTLHVSSSMFRSLNDSVHLSQWLVPSRHISTSELRNRSWIELTFESFRVLSASTPRNDFDCKSNRSIRFRFLIENRIESIVKKSNHWYFDSIRFLLIWNR